MVAHVVGPSCVPVVMVASPDTVTWKDLDVEQSEADFVSHSSPSGGSEE